MRHCIRRVLALEDNLPRRAVEMAPRAHELLQLRRLVFAARCLPDCVRMLSEMLRDQRCKLRAEAFVMVGAEDGYAILRTMVGGKSVFAAD